MTRNTMVRLFIFCAGALTVTSATLAHHSFAAQYDSNQVVELQGRVTKVEWMNPHSFFYIDVVSENGDAANWAIEGGAPNVLYRRGLTFEFTDGRCLFFGVAELGGGAREDCAD
jgi:hypothetical protein